MSAHPEHTTARLTRRVLTRPTGTAVDAEIGGRACDVIRVAVENAPQVRRRLQSISHAVA
jgi:hypothetical protein